MHGSPALSALVHAPAALAASPLVSTALAWLLTYALHSTLLLAGAWLVTRHLRGRALGLQETIWRVALMAGLITATAQLALGAVGSLPAAGRIRIAAPLPAPEAAAVSAGMPGAVAASPAAAVRAGTSGAAGTSVAIAAGGRSAATVAASDAYAAAGEANSAVTAAAAGPLPRSRSRVLLAQGAGTRSAAASPAALRAWTASVSPGAATTAQCAVAAARTGRDARRAAGGGGFGAGRGAGSWMGLVMGAWLLGALVLSAAFLRSYLALRGRLRYRPRVVGGDIVARLGRLVKGAGIDRPVRLTCTWRLRVPVALGGRPAELCVPPRALFALSDEHQDALLAHELGHLVRRDPVWLVVTQLLACAFFFQPLNWVARRRLRELSELLCDEWAVRRTGRPLSLAACLTEVAGWSLGTRAGLRGLGRLPVPSMASRPSQLARRIRRLLERHPADGATPSRRTLLIVLASVLLAVIVAAPGFSVDNASFPAAAGSAGTLRPLVPAAHTAAAMPAAGGGQVIEMPDLPTAGDATPDCDPAEAPAAPAVLGLAASPGTPVTAAQPAMPASPAVRVTVAQPADSAVPGLTPRTMASASLALPASAARIAPGAAPADRASTRSAAAPTVPLSPAVPALPGTPVTAIQRAVPVSPAFPVTVAQPADTTVPALSPRTMAAASPALPAGAARIEPGAAPANRLFANVGDRDAAAQAGSPGSAARVVPGAASAGAAPAAPSPLLAVRIVPGMAVANLGIQHGAMAPGRAMSPMLAALVARGVIPPDVASTMNAALPIEMASPAITGFVARIVTAVGPVSVANGGASPRPAAAARMAALERFARQASPGAPGAPRAAYAAAAPAPAPAAPAPGAPAAPAAAPAAPAPGMPAAPAAAASRPAAAPSMRRDDVDEDADDADAALSSPHLAATRAQMALIDHDLARLAGADGVSEAQAAELAATVERLSREVEHRLHGEIEELNRRMMASQAALPPPMPPGELADLDRTVAAAVAQAMPSAKDLHEIERAVEKIAKEAPQLTADEIEHLRREVHTDIKIEMSPADLARLRADIHRLADEIVARMPPHMSAAQRDKIIADAQRLAEHVHPTPPQVEALREIEHRRSELLRMLDQQRAELAAMHREIEQQARELREIARRESESHRQRPSRPHNQSAPPAPAAPAAPPAPAAPQSAAPPPTDGPPVR